MRLLPGQKVVAMMGGMGMEVFATTRRPERADALKANGVDHVIVDMEENTATGNLVVRV